MYQTGGINPLSHTSKKVTCHTQISNTCLRQSPVFAKYERKAYSLLESSSFSGWLCSKGVSVSTFDLENHQKNIFLLQPTDTPPPTPSPPPLHLPGAADSKAAQSSAAKSLAPKEVSPQKNQDGENVKTRYFGVNIFQVKSRQISGKIQANFREICLVLNIFVVK